MTEQNQPYHAGFLQFLLEGYLKAKNELPRISNEIDSTFNMLDDEKEKLKNRRTRILAIQDYDGTRY